MKKIDRSFPAAFCLAFLLLLTGCSGRAEKSADTAGENPVRLIYYTIGEPDPGLGKVEEALNRLLLERYGFTVSYHKIGWNDYEVNLNSFFNTNQKFDIAFAWTENYLSNALSGNWLALTPYMDNILADTYRAVNGKFWKGAAVNGSIYGIPTNKELAVSMFFLYDRELVEKYGIDISQYHTLESLEPLLQMIDREEPDYIPMFLSNSHVNLASMGDYEYVAYTGIPLGRGGKFF